MAEFEDWSAILRVTGASIRIGYRDVPVPPNSRQTEVCRQPHIARPALEHQFPHGPAIVERMIAASDGKGIVPTTHNIYTHSPGDHRAADRDRDTGPLATRKGRTSSRDSIFDRKSHGGVQRGHHPERESIS